MGMTMTQKILAKHAGLASVEAGQLIEADLDKRVYCTVYTEISCMVKAA